MTDREFDLWKAESEFAGSQGERWRQAKLAEFEALPPGTVVLLNVANGRYVTGTTADEARQKFDQVYGRGVTLAYSFTVGRPVFVGGGLG